jgi:uncharacterized surface protein with fasciclin (FAS1) repeats
MLGDKDQIVSTPAIPGYTLTAIREADGKVSGLDVVVPGDRGVFKRVADKPVPVVITPAAPTTPTNTVVDVAAGNAELSTFMQLLKASGLDKTLAEAEPFTILAPNNKAFSSLSKSAVDDLLKPENKAKLVALLQKHVIKGKLSWMEIAAQHGKSIKTLGGEVKILAVPDGKPRIGKASIVQGDISASNGMIQVIDSVLK